MPTSTYYAVLLALVLGVGCGKGERLLPPEPPKETPKKLITNPIVEKAIREQLKKPTGELTKADLEKVTDLNLNATQITDAGLKDIAKLQNLTILSLFDTKITDAGLIEVAKLKSLTRLILGFTKITDAGLKEVAKLQNLEDLRLDDTKITDAGLKDLAKLQNLTLLTLSAPKVTKAGVAELQKTLPKCKIYSNPTK